VSDRRCGRLSHVEHPLHSLTKARVRQYIDLNLSLKFPLLGRPCILVLPFLFQFALFADIVHAFELVPAATILEFPDTFLFRLCNLLLLGMIIVSVSIGFFGGPFRLVLVVATTTMSSCVGRFL
jgi:hypothetical protein